MEQFRVGAKTYRVDELAHIDDGGSGSVYSIDTRRAVKIYFDKPSAHQIRKLIHLFDISARIEAQAGNPALAMPLEPAVDAADAAIAGFSMALMERWIPLSLLNFDPRQGQFRDKSNFRFDDQTAVRAVFDLFRLLAALEKQHIAIGDISGKNILVDPSSGNPGLIDMDSVNLEDWESDSRGTPGYVDPHVFDGDLNSLGGYHFDSKSDVFSMTVVAFSLLIGLMPFYFGTHPPVATKEEFARKRLSSLRVAVEGPGCLQSHGLQLADPGTIDYVKERVSEIRRVTGQSGRDGELICQHFTNVLVHDGRQSLLDLLPEEDNRSPAGAIFERLRTSLVLGELALKYEERPGVSHRESHAGSIGLAPLTRSSRPFVARDPSILRDFLKARHIDFAELLS